ncbi:hypothetical protein TNCV_3120051 [Trichonephila clavipes]|uniref:Uncharacterized protein n=1 Tax=Trichonephila clavipes TaxID=2585209 RepID=A0A8X6W9M9_TRICX|nr:hypothetical protein TNCV_3120051 [Trichonephila clavipes]
MNWQPSVLFHVMSPVWLRWFLTASTRRKISQRLLGLESLRKKKGVVSYEDLITINVTKFSTFKKAKRTTGLRKSADFINEVLDEETSVRKVTEKERQERILREEKNK